MSIDQIEQLLVLAATAAACALPGVYLVLRRMALMSDAIGHVLLFGIVIAYFIVGDLRSPWLILGAALSGLLTVVAVESLQRSKLVKEDAAIGLVFPALFAAGILLATLYMRNTHLDVDAVLLGVPEFAVSRRLVIGGYDCGPQSLVVMGIVLLLNLLFILICYKELKLATFDAALAAAFGFLPGLLHYLLMGAVSLTAVTAFDAVGAVLVVAFMVVPAATALLLTHKLSLALLLSAVFGVLAAVLGSMAALWLDTTTAGTIASMLGLQFVLVFAFAPEDGLLATFLKRRRQRHEFEELLLLVHLHEHEETAEEAVECQIASLHEHLSWRQDKVTAVLAELLAKSKVERAGPLAKLTATGRKTVDEALPEVGK